MQFFYSNFLSLSNKDINISFDQTRMQKNYLSFITHAHKDHITNSFQKTFATNQTIDLIKRQIPNNHMEFYNLDYNKEFQISKDLTITPLNAGHILGSSMYYIQNNNKDVLFTGDINTKDSLLFKGAKPIHVDTLIIESTFAREDFKFQERYKTFNDLEEMIKKDLEKNKLVILGGYSLGKNQEIIKFLNNYLNIKPVVDKETYDFSKIYNNYGYNLKFELLNNNLNDFKVLIMPLSLINRYFLNSLRIQLKKQISPYVMTGWNFSRGCRLLNLSDHSDLESMLDFINKVNPNKVYTMHGFYKEFSSIINRKLGIKAYPINEINKKSLLDFRL